MSEIARRFAKPGRAADPWGAAGLMRRAWRAGNATAADNQAMTCFNEGDLAGYRRWLRRAAWAGDAEATAEIARFEVRLSHGSAHDIRRGRPRLPHDGFWPQVRVDRRKDAMTRHL